MNVGLIFGATGMALFLLGLHALFVRPHPVHKIVGGNVSASGVFLFLVHTPGAPDAVGQALALTGIVVSVAVTGFAAALVDRLLNATGRARLDDDDA